MDARARRYAVPAAVAAAVVLASVVEPPATGSSPVTVGPVGADKVAHAVGYALVTAALLFAGGRADAPGRRRRAALAVLAAVALGAALEGVQATLPARTLSPGDALANAIGALAAALGWLYRSRRRG